MLRDRLLIVGRPECAYAFRVHSSTTMMIVWFREETESMRRKNYACNTLFYISIGHSKEPPRAITQMK